MSREQILKHIDALTRVLETDLGAAEPLLLTLRAGTLGTELESNMNEIAAEVDVFNIDHALNLLAALQQRIMNTLVTI